MHPDLLNNSLFLKYYRQWQRDPESIVFAPIADFFVKYGMIQEAFDICKEGLKRHPDFISGRIVMAKVLIRRGKLDDALDMLKSIEAQSPKNPLAPKLIEEILKARGGEKEALISGRAFAPMPKSDLNSPLLNPEVPPEWGTLTMAQLLAKQGHYEKAKAIYNGILSSDPNNEAAKKGLSSLPS